MALDRWIALIILLVGLVYGYTAFFTMDAGLPPFMQRNPIWPSTFPKVLSFVAIIASLIILVGRRTTLIILMICVIARKIAEITVSDSLPTSLLLDGSWIAGWPATLVIIAGLGFTAALPEDENPAKAKELDIDYRRLGDYHLGQALTLLGLMVVYALCLRPVGFLISTTSFLVLGSVILGERKWHIMVPVSLLATFVVWYLVQEVLGIFLRPLPSILGG